MHFLDNKQNLRYDKPQIPNAGQTPMILSGHDIFNNTPLAIAIDNGSVQSIRETASADRMLLIAPSLIDIQVNGFMGFDLNVETVKPSDVSAITRALWRVGTGFFCPTVVTGSFERIAGSLRAIVKACEADAQVARSVIGIHLEGPYISSEDGPRGAHPREHTRDPGWGEFQRWQDIAEGKIRLVTLAPERKGAVPFIEKLVKNGIVVALGHTNASESDIQAAIKAGARLSTHLGNGAHAVIRRHPNYIWEQLAADELWASLIVDGHHLPRAVVKSMMRAKTLARCILISDAVALAGMPPGVYQFAGKKVELTDAAKVCLIGTEYLAGSALELMRGVENSVRFAGISLAEAFGLATKQPARLLGVESLHLPESADLVFFRWDAVACKIEVLATIFDGKVVYENVDAHFNNPDSRG